MKGIAFVPARGGSKRLRDKNSIELFGKPLIYHTLDALAEVFDKVVVASDSLVIIGLAKKHSSEPECVELPPSVTTDHSTVLEAMSHLVFEKKMADDYDFLGQFLATCPLRTAEDVEVGVSMLSEDVDGVVSTTDYDFPPQLGLCTDPYGLLHCADSSLPWLTGNTRSQDHNGILRPNGAVYLRWTKSFKLTPNFYAGKVKSYWMPKSRSLDVDTIEDLKTIEAIHGDSRKTMGDV